MTDKADTYHRRELSRVVQDALRSMPVVVITGLRQAGKTTFLRRDPAVCERRFFNLDDFALLEAARQRPESLFAESGPITIDEAQRCPELFLAIKQEVDRQRQPGRFLLSGSANLLLLSEVTESLAGRALYLHIHPFTRREASGRVHDQPVLLQLLETGALPSPQSASERVTERQMLLGGMPSVILEEVVDPALWFLGYEQTYLERDLRDLSQVADLVAFRNLLRLAALRTGQVLNQSELGRDARLPAATTARYLGLLEASFVIDRLPPFLRSRGTRLIKSPKVFFGDSGLACHMSGVTDLSPESDEPLRGAILETYVYQNLAGILSAHLPQAELGFWNLQGRHEVDFVITLGRKALAVEVKAGSRFHPRDLSGLRSFRQKAQMETLGVLAYNGEEAIALEEGLFAMPLGMLLG